MALLVPVRDPPGAMLAALGRDNGPWEGVKGGVELGPFAAQGLWAPVTDGWPPLWVAEVCHEPDLQRWWCRRDEPTLWKVKRRVECLKRSGGTVSDQLGCSEEEAEAAQYIIKHLVLD